MQRVAIVFVGILSVVWASPFDPDRSSPFRYKFKSNNDTLKDDSNKGNLSIKGLLDFLQDIQICDLMELQDAPEKGCAYFANGNVLFFRVLSAVDVEDVNKAFKGAGIKECEVGEDGHVEEPPVKWLLGGCLFINENLESFFWISVWDDDAYYKDGDDIKDAFDVEKCDLTYPSPEACAMYDQEGIHILDVLNQISVDDLEKIVSRLDISECIYEEEHGLINKDRCYLVNLEYNSIHFLNVHRTPEDIQDNDDDNLQQLKLKGLFNQRSSVAKNTKAVLPKKMQSRKHPQEVQQDLGRRGHQHDQHGNNGGRVNRRPSRMEYI